MTRHRLDPVALVAAGVFGVIAVLRLGGLSLGGGHQIRLAGAVVLLAAGAALVGSALRRARSGSD